MERDFWMARWAAHEIGFHRVVPNAHLIESFEWLTREQPARVLVPLCGKTLDMRYLAERGCTVVGVELAEQAAQEFFADNQIAFTRTERDGAVWYEAERITIVVGDFFALTPKTIGVFDAVFDRAAIVALPPAMRARYATHLATFFAPEARMLLLTFVYDGNANGPPFSVLDAEVQQAYGALGTLERTFDADAAELAPRLLAQGATHVREHVWRFVARG